MVKDMTKKKKTNREGLCEQLDERTRIYSHPTSIYKTVTFIEKGFPEESFLIWKEDCKKFNDIYWIKMWNDHIKAQAYDLIVAGGVQYVKDTSSTADEKEEKENLGLLSGE